LDSKFSRILNAVQLIISRFSKQIKYSGLWFATILHHNSLKIYKTNNINSLLLKVEEQKNAKTRLELTYV
jgi:hypothetical protein